jgi:hypothetical protein
MVQDRHFIDEPVIEPEKGDERDGVDKEGGARPAAETDEQPAQHRLCAETADHQRACGAQMLISGREHQRLHHMWCKQTPEPEDEIGKRDQALDVQGSHGIAVAQVARNGACQLRPTPRFPIVHPSRRA